MAHFYAEVRGRARTTASRLGTDQIYTTTKSWAGEVNVRLYQHGDVDMALVTLEEHGGGRPVKLYHGPCGAWETIGDLGRMSFAALSTER